MSFLSFFDEIIYERKRKEELTLHFQIRFKYSREDFRPSPVYWLLASGGEFEQFPGTR